MRDVHQRVSQGICTRLFSLWDVHRSRERELEWLLVDVSIATRFWGSWSAVSTRRRRLGLHSMLAGLFVAFAMQIQIDATMERQWRSVQGHPRTDENRWLNGFVEPLHIGWGEIKSILNMCFLSFDATLAVLQVFDDKIHEFMWTVHAVQFVKQAVMPQLIESLGEIDVYDERSGLL